MKINGIPPSSVISQYIQVKGNVASQTSVMQNTDKVELTNESQTFSAALKEAKQAIQTRTTEEQKRIEEVTQLVRENNYSISGEDVAAKMLGLEE